MRQETIERIRRFTADRDWEQFHTPANLAKSISIEANELLECYQWNDEADLEHVREELADVIVYWAPLKTLIAAGRLNSSHLRLAKILTALQAACAFCKSNLAIIHLVGQRDSF